MEGLLVPGILENTLTVHWLTTKLEWPKDEPKEAKFKNISNKIFKNYEQFLKTMMTTCYKEYRIYIISLGNSLKKWAAAVARPNRRWRFLIPELLQHTIYNVQFSTQHYETCKEQESIVHPPQNKHQIKTIPEVAEMMYL